MELSALCVRCGPAFDLRSDNIRQWQVLGEDHVCPDCLHAEQLEAFGDLGD
jgi:hypothetical protein